MKTKVLIVGAGLMGTAIARELSRYNLDITMVEKASDISAGTSKATSAIVHSGYDVPTDTLKGKLGVRGNELYENLCKELDVPYQRVGSLLLAFNDEDMVAIEEGYANGIRNGVKDIRIIDKEELHKLEPHISEDAFAALYAPSCGVVGSYELAIALAESACSNGVKLIKEAPVTAIERKGDIWVVQTPKGEIEAEYIINAAGIFADTISHMAGDDSFEVEAFKGEEYIFDRNVGHLTSHVLETASVGVDVLPTAHGNLMIGTTRVKVPKDDLTTSRDAFLKIFANATKVVPGIPEKSLITSFAGLRAINTRTTDYIIEISEKASALLNVSICSPGICAAPAIAEEVVRIVGENWCDLVAKESFCGTREGIVDFKHISEEERQEWIKKDPRYGRVICRCETVTEGQIVEAIRRGATTLDGVKYRTRAGMGRCQGGFCGPRIIRILERELGVTVPELTKKGEGSNLMPYEVKQFLKGGEGNDN